MKSPCSFVFKEHNKYLRNHLNYFIKNEILIVMTNTSILKPIEDILDSNNEIKKDVLINNIWKIVNSKIKEYEYPKRALLKNDFSLEIINWWYSNKGKDSETLSTCLINRLEIANVFPNLFEINDSVLIERQSLKDNLNKTIEFWIRNRQKVLIKHYLLAIPKIALFLYLLSFFYNEYQDNNFFLWFNLIFILGSYLSWMISDLFKYIIKPKLYAILIVISISFIVAMFFLNQKGEE